MGQPNEPQAPWRMSKIIYIPMLDSIIYKRLLEGFDSINREGKERRR